jgi:1A family penicillin-binding protein
MGSDKKSPVISFKVFLEYIGKPIFILIITCISTVYVLVVGINRFFIKIKSLLTNQKIAKDGNKANLPKAYKKRLSVSRKTGLPIRNSVKWFFFTLFQLRIKLLVFKRNLHFNLPFPTIHISLPKISLPKIYLPSIKIHYLKFALSVFIISLGYLTYIRIFKDLPHPKDLLIQKPAITTNIYDRNGQLLYQIYKDENRHPVSLSTIPPQVIKATLAIEDAEFYEHPGFSIRGILRAARINATKDKLQGGSTITQQLVKNTLLTPERTLERKIKELVLSVAVESYFTKDEILSMYLNEVGYGGTAYGIEAAAQNYFGKSVTDLSLAEAALIAGLPAAPTTYSPFGTNPELALVRQKEVLRRMRKEGYITSNAYNQALNQTLTFASPTTNINAPHFVMYVKDELVHQYGENTVNQGGLEVTTTLDSDIQELVEVTINQEIDKLKRLNVNNAAVIVTKPSSGEILAMAGSVNYFDSQNDGQVNVTIRPRQPGSSIKPITYAYALEHGFTPTTIINDAPVVFEIAGSEPYAPKNYDGRYHGHVTLRQALASSYNIPAVKTLDVIGVSSLITLGQNMGITTWNDPSRFGLALTLGGGEVTLHDMATVYGTFANLGYKVPLDPIVEISDFTGSSLQHTPCGTPKSEIAFTTEVHAMTSECRSEQVILPTTAYLISDILSDNRARSAAFGTNSVLNIAGNQVAVKTGTTNSLRDNWTIGYTKDYVVAVWVGNNDNQPMSYIASGITGASPIWSNIMTALLKDKPPHTFEIPPDLVKVTVCPLTGTLTCSACPNPITELFTKGNEPTKSCSNEQINQLLNPDESDQDGKKEKQKPGRDRILTGISTEGSQVIIR